VQYVFLWAWGRQTQGPPWAAHTLATPLHGAMIEIGDVTKRGLKG